MGPPACAISKGERGNDSPGCRNNCSDLPDWFVGLCAKLPAEGADIWRIFPDACDTGGLTGPVADSALGAPSGTFGVSSNFNGWNAEVQYGLKPRLGIVADVDGHYGTPITASGAGVSGVPRISAYSFLFGPAFSYGTKTKMTPFAHALFGLNRASLSAGTISGLPPTSPAASAAAVDTAFGMALGGGLDYKLSRRAAFRIGQLDYLYTAHDLNSFYGDSFGPGRFQGLATHREQPAVLYRDGSAVLTTVSTGGRTRTPRYPRQSPRTLCHLP
jgi:opacity protein-like surface antigen